MRSFAPVVKMTSIRTVLGIVTSMDLEVEQLDMKTTFLHGDLEEEIYMHQPEGFEKKGKEHLVCRLKKSLYGPWLLGTLGTVLIPYVFNVLIRV